jgi:hypothetical protein
MNHLMSLTQDLILEWYERYDNDPKNDNELESQILVRTTAVKSCMHFASLLRDKNGILKWKGALRNIGYYDSLTPRKCALLRVRRALLPKETHVCHNAGSHQRRIDKYCWSVSTLFQ